MNDQIEVHNLNPSFVNHAYYSSVFVKSGLFSKVTFKWAQCHGTLRILKLPINGISTGYVTLQ